VRVRVRVRVRVTVTVTVRVRVRVRVRARARVRVRVRVGTLAMRGSFWRTRHAPWSWPKTQMWSAPPLRSKYGHVACRYSVSRLTVRTPVGSRSRKPQFICHMALDTHTGT